MFSGAMKSARFSIALQGANVGQMLAALHGEGHPALWFLGLRAGHALIGNPILPILSVAVAVAAMALLLSDRPSPGRL